MKHSDDRQADHELKAYLDGRDGVSAAYRQTAREEPPAALDRQILDAARAGQPRASETRAMTRRPYALAASVMLAIAAVSLYYGSLEEVVQQRETTIAVPVQERAFAPPQRDAVVEKADTAALQEDTAFAPEPAAVETARAQVAEAERRQEQAADTFEAQQPASPPPAVNAGNEASATLEEIQVTGSRIVRRDPVDRSYRNSREQWLAHMSEMVLELQRRSRLAVAERSYTQLVEELEAEIDLFLSAYPDTDVEAELGLE